MSGHPQKIGNYREKLRANQRKIGTLWEEPDDYRKSPRSQSQPQPQPPDIAEGLCLLERAREQAESQPDMEEELRLLEKARAEILNWRDKAIAILRQESREDCQEAVKALERGAWMMLADLEEADTSPLAQAEAEDVSDKWTPEDEMTLLLLIEKESRVNREKARSLLAQLPSNNSQTRSIRKKI
ncbi:unnamed protein product [Penicillium egyptiacum]|uniref:Uncharacterized protein n=1 Tax=Penicillium egyptiacum TaxID=1303716 RepID=A0A9W4KIP7_9EURO|nr:unnamed protein product [Penicillium egyptiacum]